jgi:two-component sensor histidine kinase
MGLEFSPVNFESSVEIFGDMALTGLIGKRWWQWMLLYLLWTLLGLAFGGQLYLSRSKIGDPVTWGFAFERALADWYVFALLSIPALWVGRRFPFARGGWYQAVIVHVLASGLFSLSWMVLRAAIEHWETRGDLYPVSFHAALSRALVATFFFNLLVYGGVILAQHAFDYYRKFHERELHTAELEMRLTQARLQALQMQLNPHFLFNTLHAISSLMHQDVEAADRMIARLSELLRYTLESTLSQEVSLREELEFLDRYLEIQRARFGDRLDVRHDIDPETLGALVPNLLLQPLVENAIQHGIAPHSRAGQIVLRAARRAERLELEVQDNGGGLPGNGQWVEGVGLANTRARLHQLYGQAQRFELMNADGGGVVVRVSLPWHDHAKNEQ